MNQMVQPEQLVRPDIHSLVPHSGPMSLLGRFLEADDETLSAEVDITPESMFCTDGQVGAWVGVEYMAQAVAAHAGWCARRRGEPVRVGFLLGARKYACAVSAFPVGSVLRVHVRRALQGENGLGAFDCRIEDAAGQELATATITVFQPDHVEEFLQRSSV
ncbi:ApeP family dehydratase [Massilia alkalitolerans]|jgi:predicted hotdog family 3-hydroxylacyl-ACP dehydratase|uniref:ApeP family dehydratase n=1 Tax=Massilia alkalitolerans TaxID=286638 RepID=UPI00040F56C5|nr:hotdog family protein [Massilia alkalitolerans]